jgi:hypothetical protein
MVSGDFSHAAGLSCNNLGNMSYLLGDRCSNKGDRTLIFGQYNYTNLTNSVIVGQNNILSGMTAPSYLVGGLDDDHDYLAFESFIYDNYIKNIWEVGDQITVSFFKMFSGGEFNDYGYVTHSTTTITGFDDTEYRVIIPHDTITETPASPVTNLLVINDSKKTDSNDSLHANYPNIIMGSCNTIGDKSSQQNIILGHSIFAGKNYNVNIGQNIYSENSGINIGTFIHSPEEKSITIGYALQNNNPSNYTILHGGGLSNNNTLNAFGKFNEDLPGRYLEFGNGDDSNNKQNLFEIHVDGQVRAPEATPSIVDNDLQNLVPISYLLSAEFGNRLPTTDPGEAGRIWVDAGHLVVSNG